jgi:signal transduction histidine kinase
MSTRRSLKLPITLAVVMIVLLVAVLVGWVLLTVLPALEEDKSAPLYWTLLSVGTAFLVTIVVGVVLYLVLAIKTVNLNRRQSNFIDSVTHELKSPLASLKLCLQTLNRRQVSDEERVDFYRLMLEDTERLDHLINDVLEAGKVEKSHDKSEEQDIALHDLLAECVETVTLRYRTLKGSVTLDAQPAIIRARRIDLEMIFRNVIDNAVKYSGTHARVTIHSWNNDGGQIVTEIADNGRGIPKKLRRKIFGRFVRLGSELQREQPGTGLGLYIVRTLVKRLRGSIQVRDGEQGRGTVFEIRLSGRADVPSDETTPTESPPKETPSPADVA